MALVRFVCLVCFSSAYIIPFFQGVRRGAAMIAKYGKIDRFCFPTNVRSQSSFLCVLSTKPQSAAKTLDMCNNPLTKTPKLENAMRIAPEWTDYDQQVHALRFLRATFDAHFFLCECCRSNNWNSSLPQRQHRSQRRQTQHRNPPPPLPHIVGICK